MLPWWHLKLHHCVLLSALHNTINRLAKEVNVLLRKWASMTMTAFLTARWVGCHHLTTRPLDHQTLLWEARLTRQETNFMGVADFSAWSTTESICLPGLLHSHWYFHCQSDTAKAGANCCASKPESIGQALTAQAHGRDPKAKSPTILLWCLPFSSHYTLVNTHLPILQVL